MGNSWVARFRMSQFEELTAFVTVVDRGSFSKAAEQLGLVKSAISKKVTDLENRLGVKLLNRTTRRLNLTAPGKDFYERAKQILADVAEAEAAVSDEHAALSGTLKIAAPLSFGVRYLMPIVEDFLKENSALHIDIDFNDRQVNMVEEGFDVAVRLGQLQDSSLMARKFADFSAYLCASPAYLKAHGEPQTPADLQQHQALIYSNRGKHWQFSDAKGHQYKVQMASRLHANNGDALKAAAEAGLGLVMLPSFIVNDAIKTKRLRILLPDYKAYDIAAYAVYPQTRYVSQRVRVFIDYLAARFAENRK